jgi:hypothetical protein
VLPCAGDWGGEVVPTSTSAIVRRREGAWWPWAAPPARLMPPPPSDNRRWFRAATPAPWGRDRAARGAEDGPFRAGDTAAAWSCRKMEGGPRRGED